MDMEWVIARTFTDPDGTPITRYWNGGKNWHDEVRQAQARFTNPEAARERYEANVRATGKRWQGEISVIKVVARNICSPTGKVRYQSRELAERFLVQIWQDRSRRAQRNRRECRAYQCDHQPPGQAPHWHLTSKQRQDEIDPTRSSKVG